MKTAVYPGSFNPWHRGHSDILIKSLQIFDTVHVARGINPEKNFAPSERFLGLDLLVEIMKEYPNRITVDFFGVLLADYVKIKKCDAVIRGLRNGHDLQYEMNQQYWNEDLGLSVPVVYFICDRRLSHISSSSIRAINKVKGLNE